MKVILAKTAGFCFGVKRAVEKVYKSIESGEKIYTWGPIIHNEEVVRDLEEKGVTVLENEEDLESVKGGIIVIRSHGVSRRVKEKLESTGAKVVDATCPFVLKIHNLVEKAGKEGKRVVIIGNDGHPEVEGIKGWCVENSAGDPVVISEISEAEEADLGDIPLFIVAQTTFNTNKFKDIVEILSKKGYNSNAVDTICSATQERQSEAKKIAHEVAAQSGAMIVIGGRSSSNSRKLCEICRGECENTHFIQTLADLNLELPKSIPCVGITAGASTPDNIIEEVHNYVRGKF
ncbi:MAG: 4-hydroxy-3-methylbut-2-enyl diphosphate reductase [Lachnospiraceae bacterium]|nr:4-hydroxy-3-methylbut-2-enyl diphosphate reductase [Lachnospiraceae bacterium]